MIDAIQKVEPTHCNRCRQKRKSRQESRTEDSLPYSQRYKDSIRAYKQSPKGKELRRLQKRRYDATPHAKEIRRLTYQRYCEKKNRLRKFPRSDREPEDKTRIEASSQDKYPGWSRHGYEFLSTRVGANEMLKEVPKTGSGLHVRPPLETPASSQRVDAERTQRMDVDNGSN